MKRIWVFLSLFLIIIITSAIYFIVREGYLSSTPYLTVVGTSNSNDGIGLIQQLDYLYQAMDQYAKYFKVIF